MILVTKDKDDFQWTEIKGSGESPRSTTATASATAGKFKPITSASYSRESAKHLCRAVGTMHPRGCRLVIFVTEDRGRNANDKDQQQRGKPRAYNGNVKGSGASPAAHISVEILVAQPLPVDGLPGGNVEVHRHVEPSARFALA